MKTPGNVMYREAKFSIRDSILSSAEGCNALDRLERVEGGQLPQETGLRFVILSYRKKVSICDHVSFGSRAGLKGAASLRPSLLLEEQAGKIFAMTDDITARVRKIDATTLRFIGDLARRRTKADKDASFVTARDVMSELRSDNLTLVEGFRPPKGSPTKPEITRARC